MTGAAAADPAGRLRVYAPVTPAALAELAGSSVLPVTGAFAVTDRLRSLLAVPAGDPGVDDELAEAAVVAAADECLVALSRHAGAEPRRVVVAADLDAGLASPPPEDSGAHPAAVTCPSGIPRAAIVCLLADAPGDEPAAEAVRAAVRAHREGGEADVEAALDALDEHALAWFDVSELATLTWLPGTSRAR